MGGEGMTIDEAAHHGELGIGGLMVEDIVRLKRESYRAQVREYLLSWLAARDRRLHQRSY
jgi:alpha-acetolactate decarboxylase